MQRELITYPIGPVHKTKLTTAGFLIASDLQGIKSSDLSKETGISVEECVDILNLVLPDSKRKGDNLDLKKPISVLDVLKQEQSLPHIVTFSEQLDCMLGGGIPLCKVTEFCGSPGTGKTQICLQLAVDAQIPESLGGLDAESVFIDTEGSFIIERLVDIASATVEHCKQLFTDGEDDMSDLTTQRVLSRIHYYRCHDYTELLATINLLPDFIQQHPQVKLVIIDSIAFHFRHDFEDLYLRTRLLTSTAQNLLKLATSFKLAVVLTNQMTTKVQHGENSQLIPALGESWGHVITVRVILNWQKEERIAWLYKSPTKQEAKVPYQITMGGIRDVLREGEDTYQASPDSSEENPAKRRRVV